MTDIIPRRLKVHRVPIIGVVVGLVLCLQIDENANSLLAERVVFANDPSSDEQGEAASPLTKEQHIKLSDALQARLANAEKQVQADSKNVQSFSARGDARFFLAKFDDAVADYDQMVTLDSSIADSHWRRGIALFYAGRFKDAAEQFERYHSFDQVDRENGIWRYLSQFKADGRDKARAGLLKYKKDDREPFPSVYKLFAGSIQPDEILQQIADAKISDDEREKRLFYAHLYIGLNAAVEGDETVALRHLRSSTQNTWGPVAGYGPNYMWHVGRLHEEILRSRAAKKEKQ